MKHQLLYIIISIVCFVACQRDDDSRGAAIVRVGDEVLYQEDLAKNIPAHLSTNDSTLYAEDYVKKWIVSRMLMRKAEDNLSSEQRDFSQEIEDYRISLTLYRYKNALLQEKMDTVVSVEEIENYYKDYQQNFVLNGNIVKAVYVKVPVEVANQEQLKKWCSDGEDGLSALEGYAHQYAKRFDYFNHQWVYFEEVMKRIPMEIENERQFLKKNKFIESSDNEYYYLLFVVDYRMKGDISPQEFMVDKIKNLILNKRKLTFLKNLEEEVYQDGLKNRVIKIFNHK
ncbi:hypothetical protein EYV94_05195 [Puteibacter caeruleilacunae]|nr:hypothetical protein EYV94_05195 [Puteibacter caeruleilacunae]